VSASHEEQIASIPTRRGTNPTTQESQRSLLLGRAQWILPPLVIGLLIAPMVLTSRAYASDWSNNLWLVWEQSLNIKTLGHPSYFVQSGIAAYFPQFLFYGGTLFSVVGLAASVAGEHPLAAYVLTYLVALLAAYGGWIWLCRQLGLSGWRAHVPAILYVTSSYYVTNIYGRGDFGETVATSAIPLVAAGGAYLLRSRSWNVTPLAVFAVAVVFFTGSHPLTLVWGTTFLASVGFLALAMFWRSAREHWRRIAATLGVGAIAIGVNAWTLLPTLAYHNRVLHGTDTTITQLWYSTPSALFGILRNTVNPTWITGDVQAQAPVLAIGWALLVATVCWRSTTGSMRRAVAGIVALLAALIWLTLSPTVLGSLPKPWNNIQFPFRLVSYVTLAGSALVACVLLILRQAPSRLRHWSELSLVAVTLICVSLATQQVWDTPSFYFKTRNEVFTSAVTPPPSYYSGVEYADSSAPIVRPTISEIQGGAALAAQPGIELPSSPFTASYSYPIVVPRSGTVATNVAAGPYLVHVAGAVAVGRTPLSPGGSYGSTLMVLRVTGKPGTHETVTFSTASSPAIRLGVIASGVSLAALLLVLAGVFVAGRKSRRGRPGIPVRSARSERV
jgi:hypothetical protein